MSQNNPHQQQQPLPQQPQQYGQAMTPQPGQGQSDPDTTLGIVALILSLVFFPAGFVLGLIAQSNSKGRGFKNPLGLAAVIISAIFGILTALAFILPLILFTVLSSTIETNIDDFNTTVQSQAEEQADEFAVGTKEQLDNTANLEAKNSISEIATAVSQYSVENNGALPSLVELTDGNIPSVSLFVFTDQEPYTGIYQYKPGYSCSGNELVVSSSRSFAVRTLLSDGSFYCADN